MSYEIEARRHGERPKRWKLTSPSQARLAIIAMLEAEGGRHAGHGAAIDTLQHLPYDRLAVHGADVRLSKTRSIRITPKYDAGAIRQHLDDIEPEAARAIAGAAEPVAVAIGFAIANSRSGNPDREGAYATLAAAGPAVARTQCRALITNRVSARA